MKVYDYGNKSYYEAKEDALQYNVSQLITNGLVYFGFYVIFLFQI